MSCSVEGLAETPTCVWMHSSGLSDRNEPPPNPLRTRGCIRGVMVCPPVQVPLSDAMVCGRGAPRGFLRTGVHPARHTGVLQGVPWT